MLFNKEACLIRPPKRAAKNKAPCKGGPLYKGQTELYWKLWVEWEVLAQDSELPSSTRSSFTV